MILDRNQNGLDGLPRVAAGASAPPGLYWDPARRMVVPLEASGPADADLVLLSARLDITFDELVRQMAMGGGGRSGRPVPYHQGMVRASQHSH